MWERHFFVPASPVGRKLVQAKAGSSGKDAAGTLVPFLFMLHFTAVYLTLSLVDFGSGLVQEQQG